MFGSRTTVILSTGVLLLGGSVGAAAAVSAASPAPAAADDDIHGCVGPDGALYLADHDGCRRHERPISWPRHSTPSITEQAVLPSTGTSTFVPVTTSTAANITGLSVTLPVPGKYSISANVRGAIIYGTATTPQTCYIVAQLVGGATAIPGSQRLIVIDDNAISPAYTSNVQATAPIELFYTATARNTVVTVQAFQGSDGTPGGAVCTGAPTVEVGGDQNGSSSLTATLVSDGH